MEEFVLHLTYVTARLDIVEQLVSMEHATQLVHMANVQESKFVHV